MYGFYWPALMMTFKLYTLTLSTKTAWCKLQGELNPLLNFQPHAFYIFRPIGVNKLLRSRFLATSSFSLENSEKKSGNGTSHPSPISLRPLDSPWIGRTLVSDAVTVFVRSK